MYSTCVEHWSLKYPSSDVLNFIISFSGTSYCLITLVFDNCIVHLINILYIRLKAERSESFWQARVVGLFRFMLLTLADTPVVSIHGMHRWSLHCCGEKNGQSGLWSHILWEFYYELQQSQLNTTRMVQCVYWKGGWQYVCTCHFNDISCSSIAFLATKIVVVH